MDGQVDDAERASQIQSFIVRIWLEDAEQKPGRVDWHGQITDVLSGEQQYIKNLDEIPGFIHTHLQLGGEQ